MTFSRRTFMKVAALGGATVASDAGIKYIDKLVPSVNRPRASAIRRVAYA